MSYTNNGKFKVQYSLATNFDTRLIEEIAKLDTEHSIKSVYGKLKSDIVGGGRASGLLPDISMDKLKDYVQLCHTNGLEFNYLLNSICLANMEMEKKTRNQMMDLVEQMVSMDVDWVTVSSPYLCQAIKKQFPSLKISIGVHGYACELQHIEYWKQLGADEITLQMFNSRNFDLLEKMLIYSRNSGVRLRVFANILCLHNCSYRLAHATGQAHASRSGDGANKVFIDNNVMTCTTDKIKSPAKLIGAGWIRPEDVKYYEELCEKTGNYNFTIKLVERTKSTNFLLKVVKAYLTRSYDGNLLDILLWPTTGDTVNDTKVPQEVLDSLGISEETYQRVANFFRLPNIYIDNKKLDNFFEKFVSNYQCDVKVCDDSGTSKDSELRCSYCKHWADKAISFDNSEVEQWLNMSNKLLGDIVDGSILP